MFEYTICRGRLWIDNGRREETCSHQLDWKVTSPLAITVVNARLVNASDINDSEVVVECGLGIWATLARWVPELNSNTKILERHGPEVSLHPNLLANSKWSVPT